MATYVDLHSLRNDPVLLQRVIIAILVAAETVRTENVSVPFHKNRVAWAQQAIKDPETFSTKILGLLLAQNKALSIEQINGVSDVNLQTAVDSLINTLTGIN